MTKDLLKGLNEHLKLEFRASHEYLAMSIWLNEHDLPGFATWMRKQSGDELLHAQRIIDHLVERDQKVVLPAIAAPPSTWNGYAWGKYWLLCDGVPNCPSPKTRVDENELLGPHGIRSLSRYHLEHPFMFHAKGHQCKVQPMSTSRQVTWCRWRPLRAGH